MSGDGRALNAGGRFTAGLDVPGNMGALAPGKSIPDDYAENAWRQVNGGRVEVGMTQADPEKALAWREVRTAMQAKTGGASAGRDEA